MKNILIIGATGYAKCIIDIIEQQNECKICGVIDSLKKVGSLFFGYTILGSDKDIPFLIESHNINGGVIAIENNKDRMTMFHKIKSLSKDFQFIKVISPTAVLGKDVVIGEGSVIYPRAIMNSSSTTGKFCIIKSNASLGHDCFLNDFSSIGFGANIGGDTTIGICSTISCGAIVLENVNIEDHKLIDFRQLVSRGINYLYQD